jgi:hypothetical protein
MSEIRVVVGASLDIRLDEPNYQRRIESKVRKVLFRTGKYTQKVLRSSIKRAGKKRASVSGTPPRAHISGGGGLKYVLFDVDLAKDRVKIGVGRTHPKGFTQFANKTIYYRSRTPVPQTLNDSGTVMYETVWNSGQVDVQTVLYKQYPITKYGPTVSAIVNGFKKIIADQQL